MKKDLLSLLDLEEKDMYSLLQFAQERKANPDVDRRPLQGKVLGMLFDKHSTRTRLSFEAAMLRLGGGAIFLSAGDTQIARDEPICDTARVLSRYLDILAIRTFDQGTVEEFAKFSSIPVLNALTDQYHPTQVLGDLLTVLEYKNTVTGLKYAWVGDGNNMAHSWINAASVLGLELHLACPEGFMPSDEILQPALDRGNANISVMTDPAAAIRGADVVNTDVWASMGQEADSDRRKAFFEPYQVNSSLLQHAHPDAIVMHCLPAHRGEEISETVLEGPASVIWDQAENKYHMNMAILERYTQERGTDSDR